MKSRTGKLTSLLLAGALVAAACSDDGGGDESATPISEATTTTAAVEDAAACAAEAGTMASGTLTVGAYEGIITSPDELEGSEGLAAFETAVTYAVAGELGFAEDAVVVTERPFELGPTADFVEGEKNFDLAIANISITDERDESVDFVAYYEDEHALIARSDSAVVDAGSVDDLQGAVLGTVDATGSLTADGTAFVNEVIAPEADVVEFVDLEDPGGLPEIQAALDDGSIDAVVIDLASVDFLGVMLRLTDVSVTGVLPRPAEPTGQIGMLFEEGSAVAPCVEMAMADLTEAGTIEDFETQYLHSGGTVPVLEG